MMRLWHAAVRAGRKLHVHVFDAVHCDPPACTKCGRTV